MTAWLTGVVNPRALAVADHPLLGLLITPDTADYQKHIPAFGTWAADNACFSQTKEFDPMRWHRWLDNQPREDCLWATAPDVVGKHRATVKRSARYLPVIRNMGFAAAFVAQNGATPATVPWDDFDVLFIGGVLECIPCGYTKPASDDRKIVNCPKCSRLMTEWKTGDKALALVVEAKHRQMPVHVGRVNTARRYRWCRDVAGSDTADGTMFRFKKPEDGVAEVLSWFDDTQATLFAA
jgi:hypothetical protein